MNLTAIFSVHLRYSSVKMSRIAPSSCLDEQKIWLRTFIGYSVVAALVPNKIQLVENLNFPKVLNFREV